MPRKAKPASLAALKALLEESMPWPAEELRADYLYERIHDDGDGSDQGKIQLVINGPTGGDVFLAMDRAGARDGLRFRTIAGGTASPRTHTALRILALAIKLDQDDDNRRSQNRTDLLHTTSRKE